MAAEVGGDRVGIRISPFGGFLDADDSHPYALHTYLLEELNKRDIAYVHFIEPRDPSSKGVGSPLAVHDWQHKEHNLDVRLIRPSFHSFRICSGVYRLPKHVLTLKRVRLCHCIQGMPSD